MQNQPDPKKPLLLVKYGGNAMTDNELKMKILKILSGFQKGTFQVVIVHGGGPFIKKILEEAGIKSEFIDGHRKTTHEALEYVEMALKGRVNSDLVGRLNSLNVKAVGLSGRDGQTVTARKREHFSLIDGKKVLTDLGQVGDVKSVDTKFLELLTRNNYLPVMSCTAADESGAGYNINADMFAGHIAGALKVDQFIVLTDVDGLMRDKNDPSTLIRELNLKDLPGLEQEGIIQGGMIPKTEACRIALENGAGSARIINGTRPEQLKEAGSNSGSGTRIYKD